MYTLAFDTTGSACSLILLQDETTVAKFCKEMEFGQAEMLMTQIEQMLCESHINFNELDLVAVCTGPGSFTGVRSSIAATRAFALACPNLKVCGISAFEAYASALTPEERAEFNTVLIETKRDDFYMACFDNNLKKITEPQTAYYEDIIRFLSGHKISFIGDGVERFLSRPSGLSLHAAELSRFVPIDALALCAIKKYRSQTLDFPKPLYLKAPDICVK